MDTPAPFSLRIPHEAILALCAAFVLLVPMAIWNRYVFLESNLPILGLLMFAGALLVSAGRVPRGFYFPGVAFAFAIFIAYAWSRLDDPSAFDFTTRLLGQYPSGFTHVLDLAIYYLLFVSAAVAYARKGTFSRVLWFLICGYMIAFIIRNSFDIGGLQEGYNVSPGFVLVTLLPFIFLRNGGASGIAQYVPIALLLMCILWLGLVGARTAVATLLIFYVVLKAWPIITRNRLRYFGIFWGMLLFIACLTAFYVLFSLTNPDSPLLKEALVEDTGVGFFHKRVGTRMELWIHLLFYIVQQPLFGYGTDHSTFVVSPLTHLEFTYNRDNLSAHSTYFELLYRLGIVGLLAYVAVLFSVWKVLWIGRDQWAARIAGAFLLSIIFFGSTGEYLVFSTLELRSGFGWIILGIGAGACLRANRHAQAMTKAMARPRAG